MSKKVAVVFHGKDASVRFPRMSIVETLEMLREIKWMRRASPKQPPLGIAAPPRDERMRQR